jgi:catechol 2,3-dioxygenase-like lactoylglutathione lyase family enzyme
LDFRRLAGGRTLQVSTVLCDTSAMKKTAITFKGITPFLKTKDLNQTIKFYVDFLGFVVDSKWPAGNPANCILDNGHVHLAFGTDPKNWYPDPALSGQLWIDVDDVMALHDSILGKVPVEWGPNDFGYGRLEFAIKDCNGYLLTFSQPIG